MFMQALLSSTDRKQLATDVEERLRKGNIAAAQVLVLNAVDTEVLATFVINHLLDPDVLKQLQDQGIYKSDLAIPSLPRPVETTGAAPNPPQPSSLPMGGQAEAVQGPAESQTGERPEPGPGAPPPQASAVSPAPAAPSANPQAAVNPQPPVRLPEASPTPAPAVESLVMRAETLLKTGDVSGARLLLERALESGHARAAFLLGETYDARVLARMGARGSLADAAKAREFYARAAAGGIPQASERLQSMR